jgi:hypothetical protein
VPTPTPADIAAAAAEVAETGVQSVTTDGQTTVAMDPLKQIEAADRLAARDLLGGANPQGGGRSGWRMLRPAQVVPPGGV